MRLQEHGLSFLITVHGQPGQPVWQHLSDLIHQQLRSVGHNITIPPQPQDGSRSLATEGWTLLQAGNNVAAGMTLRNAELSPWNLTLESLTVVGNKLRVRPGPEPLLLVCKCCFFNSIKTTMANL